MASTYSPKLRFELIGAGEQAGLWGNTTNKNVGQLIEQAIAGVTTVELDGVTGNYTLTALDGAPDQSRSAVILCTYSAVPAAGAINLIVPTQTKLYVVRNECGQTITVKTAAQTGGVQLLNSEATLVFCDGTDAVAGIATAGVGPTTVANGGTGSTTFTGGFIKSPSPYGTTALTSVSTVNAATELSNQVPVANGGTGFASTTAYGVITGGTTSTGAFQNAGTGSSGQVLTSNGAGALPTWQSSGGVSSVGVSGGSTGFAFSNSPITSSGTMTMSVSNASTVRSSIGLGSLATSSSVDLTSQVSNTLPVGNGGTGLTSPGSAGYILVSNGSGWTATNPIGTTLIYSVTTTSSTTVPFPLTPGTWQINADFRAGVDDNGNYDFTVSRNITILSTTTSPGIRFRRSGGGGYGRIVYGTNIGTQTVTISSSSSYTVSVSALIGDNPSFTISGAFGLMISLIKIS